MSAPTKRLLLCDCAGTMAPDAKAIAAATGLACSKLHRELCQGEAAQAAAALGSGDQVIIACGQQAEAFAELAQDLGAAERLECVDIRDRAGWSDEPATAKMAALIAGAQVTPPPVHMMDVDSDGICLIYGPAEAVLPAAARLAPALSVTCMVTDAAEAIPPEGDFDIVSGKIARLSGALGNFSLTADGFAELAPAGRGARRFGERRDAARSDCDIVVDLSGGQALVPAAHKRDGYLRADPRDPLAVERALFDAAQLVGQFEKPLYIRFTESLCAHSRAGQTGCTRCLDLCPTGAIAPNGDHVTIDPDICAGCGACAAVCPSGAAAADDPPVAHLFQMMRTMAETFRNAGGEAPRLLIHDDHGAEMIRLAARFGRGLPGDVIPLELPSLGRFGHAELLAALALGYRAVDILAGPRTERAPLQAEIALADAICTGAAAPVQTPATGAPPSVSEGGWGGGGAERLRLIDPSEPDALSDMLYGAAPAPLPVDPILAQGGRRETVRLAARALAGGEAGEPIPLPEGAPYGAVIVNTDACTLCLSCAGLCPTGALSDNPNSPELNFREEACIQCGLCRGLCPESAISLAPQLDLSDATLRPRVLNEEEPFACIECGKLFGVKSTIERITAKLEGVHHMFTSSDNVSLIKMCDDCRVKAQFHRDDAPLQMGQRHRVRTTEDYLAERDAAKNGNDRGDDQ